MEIQTRKRMWKANIAENEVRLLLEEVANEPVIFFAANTQAVPNTVQNEVWGRTTAKVDACEVVKHSQQDVRDKQRALKGLVLNHSDQLTTRILETTTGQVHVPY